MIDFGRVKNSRAGLAAGAAVLVALGAVGGAGAVQATRPSIEMAPTVRTPIAMLATKRGVVTVKGRVAEVYGDRFVVQDASGRALIAAGREARGAVTVGQPVMVQGRYDDGQLRASYLVDQNGSIAAVGPVRPRQDGPGGPGGPGPRGGPGRDGPPPPPPEGCRPAPGGPGGPGAVPQSPPPPPVNGAAPAANAATSSLPSSAPQTPSAGQTLPAAGPVTGRN